MRPVYFDLYYSNSCKFCIQPKREFITIPKSIVFGDNLVFFNMIDVEKIGYLDRFKTPIRGTPTYKIFVGEYCDEYKSGSRDAGAIVLSVSQKLNDLGLL
jgi:hypothetical protein